MDKAVNSAVQKIQQADAILVSASNGLSIAEGYHIFADNEDFKRYFSEFRTRYGINCLIRGVFTPMPEKDHERYMQLVHRYLIDDYAGSQVMRNLLALVCDKDYMVVTSNADTHFQMNGFASDRIFEVEGNFDGLTMQDDEWWKQQQRFQSFVQQYADQRTVVLELGIGSSNQLIKAPLMDLVDRFPSWSFITLNLPQEIYIPDGIADRSVALAGDIAKTFETMLKRKG